MRRQESPAEERPHDDAPLPWMKGISADDWQRLRASALELVRSDYRDELGRNIDLLYDFHLREATVGALAGKYFGGDTPDNRNKVSQYCKRAAEKLRKAWSILHPDDAEGDA